MAVHLGRDNVRVNVIAPGHIYTPMVAGMMPEQTRERRRKAGPLGTEGNAWDIAYAALFLASDESRWVSGVVLPVDAGLLAATPLAVYQNIRAGGLDPPVPTLSLRGAQRRGNLALLNDGSSGNEIATLRSQ